MGRTRSFPGLASGVGIFSEGLPSSSCYVFAPDSFVVFTLGRIGHYCELGVGVVRRCVGPLCSSSDNFVSTVTKECWKGLCCFRRDCLCVLLGQEAPFLRHFVAARRRGRCRLQSRVRRSLRL